LLLLPFPLLLIFAENTFSSHDAEKAREILAMLSAQVKPIMKKHGFEINRFVSSLWFLFFIA
jgi:hypothetical protein